MRKFRLHVVSLPHTSTNKSYLSCAYTQKVYNFCKMMYELGHEVYHYGAEDSNPPCTEHIQIISKDEQRQLCNNDQYTTKMYNIEWKPELPYWSLCNTRASLEIIKRFKHKDFLCLIGGLCQKPIQDTLLSVDCQPATVEYGIGYQGTFATYQCFESYAQQVKVWTEQQGAGRDSNFYHYVVPNYYDTNEFPLYSEKEDYLCFIGRLISRKGIRIAVDVAKELNIKLKIAGQGVTHYDREKGILIGDEPGHVWEYKNIEYIGTVDVKQRAELMGKAKAVMVPTYYMAPFEGTNVEAQLYGTPVITTNHNCFRETVKHGFSGYRCQTHAEFVWAANNLNKLASPEEIRNRAVSLYGLEQVSKTFNHVFNNIYDCWDQGYYTKPHFKDLSWMVE